MALAGVNRYADMIKAIIPGPFYESRGTVVPYRHGNTDIRLKADYANTVYSLKINEVYEGTVTSDIQGNVVFSRHLSLGDNELLLTNLTTGHSLSSWLTTREYAVWLISYAEVLESIDDDWQETLNDLSIENVGANGIEDRFGRNLGIYNTYGQDLNSYRWMLHEMRNSFRDYGGKVRGVESAVASITQVPPFGYTRRFWGPNWVLDQSMLANHRFLHRSCDVAFSGAGISGVTFVEVEADVPEGSPSMAMQYDPATGLIRWGTIMTPGPWVRANEGSLFIPGPASAVDPFILGLAAPFTLSASRRYLYLNIGTGTNIIDLSGVAGYPNPTVAQLVAFINITMGVVVASSYNLKLMLSYATEWIRLEPGPNNAAVELFGSEPGDLVFATSGILDGVTLRSIGGAIDIASDSTLEYFYDGTGAAVVQQLRWNSPGGAWGPGLGWVTLTDDGVYTLTDTFGYTLEVYCIIEDIPTYGAIVITQTLPFSVNYSRTALRVMETQGVFVYITGSALPAVMTFDTVDVLGDASAADPEAPDWWWVGSWNAGSTGILEPSMVDTDRDDRYKPCEAFRYLYTDAAADDVEIFGRVLQYPNPEPDKGSSYPQKNPGLLYDYEGFEVKFSGWFLSHTANAVSVDLSFTFDAGATWVSGAPAAIAVDTAGSGLENPTYLEFSTIIPAEVTEDNVWVKVHAAQGVAGLSFSIDAPHVDIKYITSRALGDTTVVRSRHRQFFGELLYLWSPERLTTAEQKYLGLQHKEASRNSPFAGVTITAVSSDTVAGTGTFEYEYNRIGPTQRLRWNSASGSWGMGLGWVVVLTDGNYVVPATDGSFLNVDVTISALPILTGTPPAATSSKTVVISDITTDQGIVRKISPAHESLDIFDATEYDSGGNPINLVGTITEVDFSVASLINLDIYPAMPFKFSYAYPTLLPVVGEALTFAGAPPHTASLLYESDQFQDEAVLFEDGVPVPNTLWQFNSSFQIQIINPSDYNPAATYTISYNVLYQITTPLLNLGMNYQDYMWLADYMLWDRMEHDPVSRINTVPVYFNRTTGRAGLPRRSGMEKTSSKLYYESSEGQVEVTPINWRFIDPFTIEMDASSFIDGAQYFLTHYEQRIYPTSGLIVTFEHRSGVDSAACLAATWLEISRNENVTVHQPAGGHLIHQLRLSVSSIRDLRDFRIRSVVLKGLHIHGSSPYLLGLTNV